MSSAIRGSFKIYFNEAFLDLIDKTHPYKGYGDFIFGGPVGDPVRGHPK